MIFGAILAGGVGSRMGALEMPKQFLPLGEKPIIIHTLEKFLLCKQFDKIYIGVHQAWLSHMKDLLEKFCMQKDRVEIVAGGDDRNSTLINVIEDIRKNYEISDENVIVTHDAVRPFVTLRMIEDNIEAAVKYGACDTVVSAIDTIVESEDGKFISSVPNRDKMYQGQTPQSFKMNMLYNLYNDLKDEEKCLMTDACKVCVIRNVPVRLVKGEVSNLKITTVSDYKIAKAMVGGEELD